MIGGTATGPRGILFPAKHRICPSAHPDLCLATFPPGGRSGGWEDSPWEPRTPTRGSSAACPPASSSFCATPSRSAGSGRSWASARSPRPPNSTGRPRRALPAGSPLPGGTGAPRRASGGGAARRAGRGSPRSPAPCWRTARSPSRPGSTSSGSPCSPCRWTPAPRRVG